MVTAEDVIEAAPEPAGSFDDFAVDQHRRLLRLAFALTGSESVAEDLTQETLLRVFKHWPTVSTLDQPSAYARRVLVNLSTSRFRRLAVETRALVRLRGDRETHRAMGEHVALFDAIRKLSPREAQ